MFRPVMEPVRQFFRRARWNSEPVTCVFGAPDRAHTEAARIYKRKLHKTKQQVEDGAVPVPFISIWRTQPGYDIMRDSRAIVRGFNRNLQAGTALKMRYPKPMVSTIQADLWCGVSGGKIAESLTAQYEMLFPAGDEVFLPIDWDKPEWYEPPFDVFEHAKVYGQTRGALRYSGPWDDNTALEYATGNKQVRLTWQLEYKFHLPFRPDEARLVRDINIDIFDQLTDDLLASLNVGAED